MKNILIFFGLIIACFIVFGIVIDTGSKGLNTNQKKENKITPKINNVYLNEPLEIAGLTIIATSVKETKKIYNYKAQNTYLQTFVKIKNNLDIDNYVPLMSLFKSGDNNFICLYDSRFVDDTHNDFILSGFVIKPHSELEGFIPFTCDDYITNSKVKERNSKPSDFEIFVNNKKTREYGTIYLREKPNEDIHR